MSDEEYQRLVDDENTGLKIQLVMALSVFLHLRFLPAYIAWFIGILMIAIGLIGAGFAFLIAACLFFVGLVYSTSLHKDKVWRTKVMHECGECPSVDLTVLKKELKDSKEFQCKKNFKCLRCARCCQGYVTMVPIHDDSDLSPRYLTGHLKDFGVIKTLQYLKHHSGFAGESCLWLGFDEQGKAFCKCHSRRSIYCSSYLPFNKWHSECIVGQKQLRSRGK